MCTALKNTQPHGWNMFIMDLWYTKYIKAGVPISNFSTLTVIAVLVNYYPDTVIWNWWGQKSFKLSGLIIVKKNYFNTIFGVYAASEVISKILYHFKIKQEIENEDKNEDENDLSVGIIAMGQT